MKRVYPATSFWNQKEVNQRFDKNTSFSSFDKVEVIQTYESSLDSDENNDSGAGDFFWVIINQ